MCIRDRDSSYANNLCTMSCLHDGRVYDGYYPDNLQPTTDKDCSRDLSPHQENNRWWSCCLCHQDTMLSDESDDQLRYRFFPTWHQQPHQTTRISGLMVFMDLMSSYLFCSQPLIYVSATEWKWCFKHRIICFCKYFLTQVLGFIAIQYLQGEGWQTLPKYLSHWSKILCHIRYIYTLLFQNTYWYVQGIYLAHQTHTLVMK